MLLLRRCARRRCRCFDSRPSAPWLQEARPWQHATLGRGEETASTTQHLEVTFG